MNQNENKSLLNQIHEHFPIDRRGLNTYSPLTLAYLGDAVYEIIIRTLLVEDRARTVKLLHSSSSHLVNAASQAALMLAIEKSLSEKEHTVYKRGRNAKPHSYAKNAKPQDYRIATGFEALIGYLYLNGQMERCLVLIKQGLSAIKPNQSKSGSPRQSAQSRKISET